MLTPKQKAFCEHYAVSHNATEAAIKAGYSRKTAYSVGSENLRKPEIKKYLEELAQEAHSSAVATKQEILEFLTDTMFSAFRRNDSFVRRRFLLPQNAVCNLSAGLPPLSSRSPK